MKLVSFNLEEALAQPERVVCTDVNVKLVKWQYNEDLDKEGFTRPITVWVDIGHTKAYTNCDKNGYSMHNASYHLMLKAKKKIISFDETLLGKDGVRVLHKGSGFERFFKYKSDKLHCNPFVFEFCDIRGEWLLMATDLEGLEAYYVMEVDE